MQHFQGVPIVSDQMKLDELTVLVRELERVLKSGIEGDIVELGCYEGTSALFEARLIKKLAPHKKLWLYDSFEGLPEKTHHDNSPSGVQFQVGELRASKKILMNNFKKADLPMPNIKKAWFSELKSNDLQDKICFAFLDGDYYESIRDSLKLVRQKLQPGAVVVVDDYQNEALPGASRAVDEWVRLYKVKIKIEKSLAIIQL